MNVEGVKAALASEKGCHVILQLMSLLEGMDVPFESILISVKVPPKKERRYVGTLFGNVEIEVTT